MPDVIMAPVDVARAELWFGQTVEPETLAAPTVRAGIGSFPAVHGAQFRLQNEQSFSLGLAMIVISIVLTRRILTQRRIDPYGRIE